MAYFSLVKLFTKKPILKFLLIGVGINLVKNPDIKDYPSTNLENILKKKINKKQIIDRLRKMYETFIIKFNSRSPSKII